ncbi:MAG: cupin domain-containing protein [Chromatiales bacterium]
MTGNKPSLIVFSRAIAQPETIVPPAEHILAGVPKQTLRNFYNDPSGQFFAGVWECEVGKWRIHYTEHEFCYLLKGRVILTDANGLATPLHQGDAFLIPAGFTGTWETVEACRKYYAVFEAK